MMKTFQTTKPQPGERRRSTTARQMPRLKPLPTVDPPCCPLISAVDSAPSTATGQFYRASDVLVLFIKLLSPAF